MLTVKEWCDDIDDLVCIDCEKSGLLTEKDQVRLIGKFSSSSSEEERSIRFKEGQVPIKSIMRHAVVLRDECNDVLENLFNRINDAVNLTVALNDAIDGVLATGGK